MTVMLLQNATSQVKVPTPTRTPTTVAFSSTVDVAKSSTPSSTQTTFTRMTTPSFLQPSCDFNAMRYYRIWIYTCNAVLLVSVLSFAIVAGKIIVADPKRYLVPGLSLYQPSFLYAYLALATQSGVLQLIGCLGALRLNERLLNVYWLLLLVLLFGDALVGVVWIFRFDKICSDLRPSLKQRLAAEYGSDQDFTTLWDALQKDYKCCGVEGAHDFTAANRTLTASDFWSPDETVTSPPLHVPDSCCRTPVAMERLPMPLKLLAENRSLNRLEEAVATEHVRQEACAGEKNVYSKGCEKELVMWLKHSADVLFVMGYCIIAFLKLCFLGILRYEIREMIQKIKMLQSELNAPLGLPGDLENPPPVTSGLNSPTTPHLQPLLVNHRENGDINAPAHRQTSPVTRLERRLQPPDSLQATPLHGAAARHHLACTDGTDSDTNSSCALIVHEDRQPPPLLQEPPQRKANNRARGSNGNNNYEVHELQELNRLLSRHHTEI